MKKMLVVLLVILTIGVSGCSNSVSIIFCGENITKKATAIMQDNEIFFPLNEFCNVIDARYNYVPFQNKLIIRNDYSEIEIYIEKDIINIDGVKTRLENRPIIDNNTIFISVKEVATALNYKVEQKGRKLIVKEVLDLITKETDETGTTYYEYDEEGKLIKKYSDDFCLTYDYDECGNLSTVYNEDGDVEESYIYSENGRLAEENNWSHIMKFDDRGNVIYRKDSNNTILEWEYDSNNNIICAKGTYPENNQEIITTYTYDSDGRCLSEKTVGNGTSYVEYIYDEHIITKNIQNSNGTKETQIYDYNENKLYTEIEGVNKIEEINYSNDKSIIEIVTNTGKRKFVFNELNLLTEEHFEGTDNYKILYTYDEYGNVLKEENISEDYVNVVTYCYNKYGKLAEQENNGETTKKYDYNENGDIYHYEDSEGNKIDYKYDEEGNLLYKNVYIASYRDFVEGYKSKGGVSVPISYRTGTTEFEYITVVR